MGNLLEMTNITKTYDQKNDVLRGINFSIAKGEIATILGASGCGKSTFLNIVGLLDSFSCGQYMFNDVEIDPSKLNSYQAIRARDIGFIFQSYCLIDSISVEENILMPFLYNDGVFDQSVYDTLDELLLKFNLSELRNKKSSLLSGGERQRVAIIRAMIRKPKLIIADEPTGNLDDYNARLVVSALNEIVCDGTSVIVVTHNEHLSWGAANTYVLEKGVLRSCEGK